MDRQVLIELGEWAAVGFDEGRDLPWPRAYGLAYRRLYEHLPVRVPEDALLIPAEPFAGAPTFAAHNLWYATALIVDFFHSDGLRVNAEIAEEKQRQYPQHAAAITALVAEMRDLLPHFGGYTHSNPDIRRVVNEGFLAIEAELDAQLAAVEAQGDAADPAELHLLRALRDYAHGVRAFHRRTAEALQAAAAAATGERRARLQRIADSFAPCFLHPAQSFLQGLLAVHFTWMLDGCDSIGRFDQALGALYARDMRDGTLDPAFARTLLDEVWGAFERLNGWNLQLGGYTPQGTDGANALTRACLAACARNHFRRPNVAFRITKTTPDDCLLEALGALRDGSGRPALYNDDGYLDALLRLPLGLTPEDARELGFGGCTETMIAGHANVGSLEGEIHLLKALELALHDGVDPVNGRQTGPRTGRFVDMRTFEDFLAAVRGQMQWQADHFVAWASPALTRRFTAGDPKLARTLFTRDCVARRRSFDAGGARYNWSVVSYQGIANLIDSVAAIKQLVYDEQRITPEELLAALAANFHGFAHLRQWLLAAPKFGNDDDRVDQPGRALVGFAWDALLAHPHPRGGRYLPSCILFTTYGLAGQQCGATPDGRGAGEPLTDSVGPMWGRDTHGPTAMLSSVLKLPLERAVGTPVLNLRLPAALLAGDTGLRAAAALIRAFFAQGGLQIQLSVLNKEDMLAAQVAPEAHRDLIVRIGGYSEYFVNLPRELQDSVIARTEHTVGGSMS